jgi:8-oxo-dGTP diphosphatase
LKAEFGSTAFPIYRAAVTQTVGTIAGHSDVSLWYLVRGDTQQALQYDSDEFQQLAWFPIDALPLERTDPHMERFAAKLRHYLTMHGAGIPMR